MSAVGRIPSTVELPSRYRIERVIGRGGAATVLAARDLRLQRDVAIKVFTEGGSTPEALMDQEREARLLAGLSHPGLVTIYDAASGATSDGDPRSFLVMEYVDGPDLAQWLRLQHATPEQVGQLGLALCSALEFVHRRGVLHCDIKPSNVLLGMGPDGELRPKLSDFGIAAVLEGDVPQGEFTVGTAAYLSPEQVDGVPLRAASDVYSLGLVLLEAATGKVAFPGPAVESAMARVEQSPAIPADLPGDLAAVLTGMTRRDTDDRWGLGRAAAAFQNLHAESTPMSGSRAPAADRSGGELPESVPLPVLRTIGAGVRIPALERSLNLVVRAVGATLAVLVTVEVDGHVLQAAHGATDEATRLAASLTPDAVRSTTTVLQDGAEEGLLAVRGIVGTRGEPLGAIGLRLPVSETLTDEHDQALADIAFVVGQLLELRAAARRALLER